MFPPSRNIINSSDTVRFIIILFQLFILIARSKALAFHSLAELVLVEVLAHFGLFIFDLS